MYDRGFLMQNQRKQQRSNGSSNDSYYTGYRTFDEPQFGKCPLERLKSQPDYRANIIWPLYQYFQASNYTSTKEEFQRLLEAYETATCINGTNCLYVLPGFMEIYQLVDADKKDLTIIVDRTHGFIPACIYSTPSRHLDGVPNKPRSNAFYRCMEGIKGNLNTLMDAIETHKDDWYALQEKLPKILNYGA